MTTLPKEIRKEINQLAHRMALRYEYDARDSILAELKEIAESGATSFELIQTLNSIATAGKPFAIPSK